MKKLLFTLALGFLLPQFCLACPSLDGKWKSSLEHFEQFNNRWAKIEPKPFSFMLQTQGNETIEYHSNGLMTISRDASEISIGERNIKQPSFIEKNEYQILGCTDNSVVLKFKQENKFQISLIHFQDKNTYWVYAGDPKSNGNSHVREYYVRMH